MNAGRVARRCVRGAARLLALLFPPAFRRRHRQNFLEVADHHFSRASVGRTSARAALATCRVLLSDAMQAAPALWQASVSMIGSDVTFALRALRRHRSYSVAAIATLVLGIGTTTAMFALVNGILLKPLPYADADRVVAIWPGSTVSPSSLATMTETRGVFAAVGAYSAWGMTVSGSDQAESLRGARLTPELLSLLGVAPAAGRIFRPDETRSGRDGVALVSAAYAGRRFGSTIAALGQRLIVNGASVEIVGVMPATFAFPDARADIWTPLTVDPSRGDYRSNFASLLGRLAPGVSAAQAEARMRIFAEALRRESPKTYGEKFLARAVVTPLQRRLTREIRTPLLLLFGSVTLLLVIACANVAILTLARATARRGEMALRSALGAERVRLVRQLLVESLLLSTIGGIGGCLLAVWLVRLAAPFIPVTLPYTAAPGLDGSVVAFLVGTVTVSTVFFGLAPAWQLAQAAPRTALTASRGGDTGGQGRRLRAALVFAEIALATVLVVSAALLGRSFVALMNVPLGFSPDRVLTLRLTAPNDRYDAPAKVTAVMDAVLQQLRAVPGVAGAGAIHLLPLTPDNWNPGVTVEGVPASAQYRSDVNWRLVTPDYFSTMAIPLRRGRALTAADGAGQPAVALVNETFARLVFGGQDPIGRRIRTPFEGDTEWAEVVGVVGDLHQHSIEDPALPEMYRPFAQHPLNAMRLMVRGTGAPADLIRPVRTAIASVDAHLALGDVEPMARVVDRTLGGRKAPALVAGVFAVAALLLGLVGISGVLSFDVAERRREIGIRLALGASRGAIQRSLFRRGLAIGLTGVAVGVAASLASSHLLASVLFGISATDPATITGVVVVFVAVMIAAMWIPARRASRVSPVETMKA